jgi:hypothetical protein
MPPVAEVALVPELPVPALLCAGAGSDTTVLDVVAVVLGPDAVFVAAAGGGGATVIRSSRWQPESNNAKATLPNINLFISRLL